MEELLRFLEKLQNLLPEARRIAAEILEEDLPAIVELQKDQLYAGRTSSGSLITPGYLEDSFFRTPEGADRYASWKDSLVVRDRRRAEGIFGPKPYGTPDLIITGSLVYDSILVRVGIDRVTFDINEDINAKYGSMLEGLSPTGWEHYREEYFKTKFIERVREWLS